MNGIRFFRRKNHMTQSELAEVLGVTQTSVSQWEGGRNYPDIKTAKRMAEMFGATLDQILGAEEMDDALLSPVASIWLDDTWNSEDGGDLFPLEQKARLLAIMNRLSPLARQRILDRAEIYLEIETLDAQKEQASDNESSGT
ncbi:MAG TPA: helix-turn-helix transcriptional regulator [Bacillota bacterium]|nr:helix-turn-helix transcriptional regulator [Bacillota bacterium]HQB81243.1 helix-turn-helix transcriptional regulator [Bacillota bacterium]